MFTNVKNSSLKLVIWSFYSSTVWLFSSSWSTNSSILALIGFCGFCLHIEPFTILPLLTARLSLSLCSDCRLRGFHNLIWSFPARSSLSLKSRISSSICLIDDSSFCLVYALAYISLSCCFMSSLLSLCLARIAANSAISSVFSPVRFLMF